MTQIGWIESQIFFERDRECSAREFQGRNTTFIFKHLRPLTCPDA